MDESTLVAEIEPHTCSRRGSPGLTVKTWLFVEFFGLFATHAFEHFARGSDSP